MNKENSENIYIKLDNLGNELITTYITHGEDPNPMLDHIAELQRMIAPLLEYEKAATNLWWHFKDAYGAPQQLYGNPNGNNADIQQLIAETPKQVIDMMLAGAKKIDEAQKIKQQWDQIEKYINENETLKNQWNSLIMSMKLLGGDF